MNNQIDPKQAALLVMDYQSGILGRLPHADEQLRKVASAIHTARDSGVQIGYVRVALTDNDYEKIPVFNERFHSMAANRGMHADAPETQIHESIAPQDGDIVVRKSRVGAFSTTDLDAQLKRHTITTLILAGISTSGVVLSTVRDASDRDYKLYVLEDGCADPDQGIHEFLIQKILPRQADIIKSGDLPKLLMTI